MMHYDDLRGELVPVGHYGGPEDELIPSLHAVVDEFPAELHGQLQVTGEKDVACSCGVSGEGFITIRFRYEGGTVEITDGPTCGLDLEELARDIEAEIEAAGEAQDERRAYDGHPAAGERDYPRPYGSWVR